MEIDFGIYVKNSAEAVELYKEAFRLELGYHVKNPDGSYFHSELSKDGKGFSVVEAQDETIVVHSIDSIEIVWKFADEYSAICSLVKGGEQ